MQPFAPPFINLSDIELTTGESNLLQRGKKFALKPTLIRSDAQSIILADLAVGFCSGTRFNYEQFKDLINKALFVPPHSSDDLAFHSLHKILRNHDFAIVQVDKMKHEGYDRRVHEFIQQSGATPVKFNLEIYNQKLRQLINNSST